MNRLTIAAGPTGIATILIVDDDDVFCRTLSTAMGRRGYATCTARDAEEAMRVARDQKPDFAVVDLRLPGQSGLMLIKRLREVIPDARMVVLTGFGSIATTVDAIKLGACYYLTKPANADEILAALRHDEQDFVDSQPMEQPPSVYRVEWEHIHRVLAEQNGNVSESARLLGIHRRTLQRKLNKHPVRR
jgi:two-component system response regulator RegA